MLGLPDSIGVCLFDLDGVLTDTASVHRRAWAQAFDAFLLPRGGAPFTDSDYADYVDGKPRADGVRDFLTSRGIVLPEGSADDPPGAQTVHGLGNGKNALLLHLIRSDGVRVYEGSRRYLQSVRDAGLRRAVVSSSANTAEVLDVTGLAEFVEGRVDGVVLAQQGLRGKPAPDSFVAGAQLFGATPQRAAVFEDAIAGVQAGRAGQFGFVVGVNRLDEEHARDLADNGADIVVNDLAELMSTTGGRT